MKNLYLEHKADNCVIAEIMTQILHNGIDKYKKLIRQRSFCEKKCRIVNCNESTGYRANER